MLQCILAEMLNYNVDNLAVIHGWSRSCRRRQIYGLLPTLCYLKDLKDMHLESYSQKSFGGYSWNSSKAEGVSLT